jgi:multidrug efflux pump
LFSRFFIDRPIFASVLSIVITLAGGLALFAMPLALYPPVSPPVVSVQANYPGASAQVVSETVAAPIEQKVNGVEGMMYMSSACTNDGSYSLSVTFQHGIDLNMAQVLVQNRVNLAVPLLPDVIKQTGVTTRKRPPDILLVIAVNSPDGRFDQLHLSNYALMRIRDELLRLPGVSDVNMLGQRDYSMRIWVDPEKLAERNLTAGDVVRALREQNAQVAAGQIGQPPTPKGQGIQVTLSTLGRLTEVQQFEDIIVRALPDGRMIRIKDVAKVELGAKSVDVSTVVNGRPSASLAVFQLPDANALDTADIVKAKIEELKSEFPEGMSYEIRYDTTPFIRESIDEVFKTLREAVILVAVVVLLFLQNWRSAIIPLIAVPVAIIGTFAVLLAMGFTLNNLTLFGLVLAIGIVVDDAIVVVEAVEHHIEHGMSPRQATIRAMDEVSGPVIAIGLVLSAVFVPCAFISGIVGQFFRQFALTIATSTIISAFNSLTLSPALAAMLLRRPDQGPRGALPRVAYALAGGALGWFVLAPWLLAPRLPGWLVARVPAVAPLAARLAAWLSATVATRSPWAVPLACAAAGVVVGWLAGGPLDRLLSAFFRLFNAGFRRLTGGYTLAVGGLLRVSVLVLLVYGGLVYLTYRGFKDTPKGFIPSQDMGYLLVNVQLPDAASTERTAAVMDKLDAIARGTPQLKPGDPGYREGTPGVKFVQTISGQSFLLNAFGSNFGSMFVILDEYAKRRTPDLYSTEVAKRLQERFDAEVPEAMVRIFPPPPVRGVGRAGGFMIMIEDRGDAGLSPLQEETERLVKLAGKIPHPDNGGRFLRDKKGQLALDQDGDPIPAMKALTGLSSVFRANVPQLYADVNRTNAMQKEVSLKDLFDTLQIYLGSLYANDFNLFGRTWQVIVQAQPRFRNQPSDVNKLKVRNAHGAMVPLGSLADIREINGPLILTRYNMYPAAQINGTAANGVSSGQAIAAMEGLVKQDLPASMAYEWTELAYLELQAGNTATIIFGFAVVMVFLVLAAQYESWSLPLAIILVVPMCILGGIAGVRVAKEDINIFTQIGFVVLVGLASKNAILIVEFAKMRRAEGESRRQATLDACRLRLRPIVMTSLAFILGVVPLIVSNGAGAEMRRTLGTTVFSGMLGVTAFGLLLTPVFFFVIDWLGETRLFASPLVRRVGGVALGALSLSPLRRLAREMLRPGPRKAAPTPPRPAPTPARTGELVEKD